MENNTEFPSENFFLDQFKRSDIGEIVEILYTWVRDFLRISPSTGEIRGTPNLEEAGAIIDEAITAREGFSPKKYYVLRNEESKAIGIAGLALPDSRLMDHTKTGKPVEMINVFLNKDYRGKGFGLKLIQEILSKAKELGYTEVIWSSGPRYKHTAWEFYTKNFGEPIANVEKFYNGKWLATIWSVEL